MDFCDISASLVQKTTLNIKQGQCGLEFGLPLWIKTLKKIFNGIK